MKGLSFDQLYPGTYLKAGEFEGRAVTLTIKSITREMLSNGSGGEEPAVTVAFAETEKQFVMNKTNAVSLRAMWGDDSGEWVGKRVTLHPVKDESGLSDSGLCIRVKGSPELEKPLKFKARLGRKMVTQTLVPTGEGTPPQIDEDEGQVIPEDDDIDAALAPVTPIGPPQVTHAQLGKIAALRKSTGIYDVEWAALLDSYGAEQAADLSKETAEYVIAALQERAS